MKKIITVPHETLRKKATQLDNSDGSRYLLQQLQQCLKQTSTPKGVGLALPQINSAYRAFATFLSPDENQENSGRPTQQSNRKPFMKIYVNPEIVELPTETTFGPDKQDPILEGCLSIPTIYGPVPRFPWVRLRYLDLQFQEHTDTFYEFFARVIQHEYDHLEGVLFTDYILKHELPLYQIDKDGKTSRISLEVAKTW